MPHRNLALRTLSSTRCGTARHAEHMAPKEKEWSSAQPDPRSVERKSARAQARPQHPTGPWHSVSCAVGDADRCPAGHHSLSDSTR